MEEMQVSQHLSQSFRRTLRIISCKEGKEVTEFDWQDVNHRDALARELYHDAKISVEECAPLMRELVQPSPGGLLALAWMCRLGLGQINSDVLLSFACGLICGEPFADALDEKDALDVFERFTQAVQLSKNARSIISFYLLSTVYISNKGRCACLARVMNSPSFGINDRKLVFQWAMGLDAEEDGYIEKGEFTIPVAPPALARLAVSCTVDVGYPCTEIVKHVITNIDGWEDRRYVLHGVLDVIEKELPDMQPSVRRQAFDVCLNHEDASLRRRVYRIAAKTESKEFLMRATKDSDASVRRWAIGMIKNK